jgi:hypothetical protein
MRKLASLSAIAIACAVAFACSGTTETTCDFGDIECTGGSTSSSGASGASSSGTSSGFGSSGTPADAGLNACASETITGTTAPVHIILAIDISGSMCDNVEGGNAGCMSNTSKWQQEKIALKAFFTSPDSKDSLVSIQVWPNNNSCGTSSNPIQPGEVALPDVQNRLGQALDNQNPNGGTPTAQAIDAALSYAKTLKASLTDNGNVVIVIATDGIPMGCNTNLNNAVTSASQAKNDGFAPYIIGVGNQLTSLDAIAAGAGTNGGKAILVQNNVSTAINDALKTIKKAGLGCKLQIPKPDGGTLDFAKVNLTFTTDTGAKVSLAKSQDCSNPDGWKYVPNETAPTSIELCTNSCKTVEVNGKGSMGVELGCATRNVPN